MIAAVVGLLSIVIGIGSLVCWIMEIVAAFKNEEGPLLGILSIVLCGLGGFVIGWIKHGQWGIKNLMLAWTGLIVLSVLINVLSVAMGIGAAAGGIQVQEF